MELEKPKTRRGFGLGAIKHLTRIAKQARQQKDIWAHRARHGGHFDFHGRTVRLPRGTKLGIRHAIVSDAYEAAERDLIKQHMPSHLPVIELGGSLGLVSGFISEQLNTEVDHLIVEANPALLDACRANATTERRADKTQVIQKAIAYDATVVRLHASTNAHTSRLGDDTTPGNVDVPACKLADLLPQIDDSAGYALVSDIEGAEFELFKHDPDALKSCQLALVEVHPDVFESQRRSLAEFLELVRGCGFKQIDHVDNVYAFART